MNIINVGEIRFGKIANALKSIAENHIVAITNDIYDNDLIQYQKDYNMESYANFVEFKGYMAKYNIVDPSSLTQGSVNYNSNIVVSTEAAYQNLVDNDIISNDTLYFVIDETGKVIAIYFGGIDIDINTGSIKEIDQKITNVNTTLTSKITKLQEAITTLQEIDESILEPIYSQIQTISDNFDNFLTDDYSSTVEAIYDEIDDNKTNIENLSEDSLIRDEDLQDAVLTLEDRVSDLAPIGESPFIGMADDEDEFRSLAEENGSRGWGYIGNDATSMKMVYYNGSTVKILGAKIVDGEIVYNTYDLTNLNKVYQKYLELLDKVSDPMTEEQYNASAKKAGKYYCIIEDEGDEEQQTEETT